MKLDRIPYSVNAILNVRNAGNIYILSNNSASVFRPLRVISIVPAIPYSRELVYKPEKKGLLQEMLRAAAPQGKGHKLT